MLKKANYKKFNDSQKTREDYILLIKDIIRLIKYYDLKVNYYGNKSFCYNQLRRYKYEKHLAELRQELKNELSFYKWQYKKRTV